MNQTQLKYAKTRAADIYNNKKKEITLRNTVTPVLLSNEEKFEALAKGEYTISETPYGSSYRPSWFQFVLFSNEELGGLDKDTYQKELALLDLSYSGLLDELVLGDNEEALRLLKEFAANA